MKNLKSNNESLASNDLFDGAIEKTRSVERQLDETENKLHRLAYMILGGASDDTMRDYARDALKFLQR